MAEVQGKYFIFAHVPNSSYTITGNDRAGNFGMTGDQVALDSYCIIAPVGRVVFGVEKRLTIKKIRLVPNGAPGLQNAPGYLAGKINLQLVTEDGDGNITPFTNAKTIRIPNWGEWYEINMNFGPWERTGGDNTSEYVRFSIVPDTAVFYCDDYNIQADYVGQGVTPRLEMLIETAGIVDSSAGVEF